MHGKHDGWRNKLTRCTVYTVRKREQRTLVLSCLSPVQFSTNAKDVGLPTSSMNQDNLHNDDQGQTILDNYPSTGMLKDCSR